jgi:hypothetical protein
VYVYDTYDRPANSNTTWVTGAGTSPKPSVI